MIRANRGFTLVEILAAISVTVIAGYLLLATLVQTNTNFLDQNSQIKEGLGLNDTTTIINESIKSAAAVAASSPTTPVYNSGATTLVLALPSIDASGNIIGGVFDYLVVTRDSSIPTILRQIIFPNLPQSSRKAQNRVLLTDLSLIHFTYLDSNGNGVTPSSAAKVNYVINVSERVGLSARASSASSEINLRNN